MIIFSKSVRVTLFITAFTLVLSLSAKAQSEVAIGSATTKSNAILWLNGNGSQGLILPTVSNKTSVSNPDKGMIVYDNSDNKVWYRNDNAWVEVGGAAGGGGDNSTLNLLLQGNQLQLRDGTTVLNSVNIAAGTQANGSFLVFQGGSWQFGQLTDATGTGTAFQVTGLRGKSLATLPATSQALVYDPAANSGNGGWVFQSVTLPTLANGQILTGNGTTNSATTLTGDATLSGGTITISNNAITTAKINANAVDGTKLADNAVTSAKITDGTITGADIANTTITANKLAQSGATNNQVLQWNGTTWVPASVTGTGGITQIDTGTGLTGGPITSTGTISIASNGVGATQLADNAVVTNKLADNSISTTKIINNAVDNTKLADNAVTSVKITDGTITGADIAATTITADKLAQSSATSGQVLKWNGTNWVPQNDNTGTTATLSNGQILIGDGTTNSASTLTGDATLSGGTITIANNAVTSAKIADGTIAAADLAAGSVSGGTGGVITDASITNADIAAAAAIAGTKITPAFGAQNITTTGTLSAGATTISGLTIGTSTWPANASGVLTNNGAGTLSWVPTGGTGTVTSVGLTLPSIFSIAGSPITTSGTLAATLVSQTAASVFAAPTSTAGAPTFRALAATDIPSLDASKITSGLISIANGGTGAATAAGALTNLGALSNSLANGNIFVGNAGGLATGVAVSGDATITNTGVITISNGAISGGTAGKIADGTITDADIANASISAGKLAQSTATPGQVLKWNGTNWVPQNDNTGTTATLSNGQILIGDGTTNSAATLVGDATLSGGIITISNNAVNSSKIADGSITGSDISASTITGSNIALTTITADKLAQSAATTGQVLKWNGTNWVPQNDNTGTTVTLSNGQILIGDGTTNSASTLTGDASLSGGTITIANNAVTSAKIADGTIAAADLAAGSVSGGTGGVITDASITNADIAAAAAIAGTKITPAFGAQAISTTGALSAGATTVSGLTIGTSVWPANAAGALTNNGTGTLTWAPSFTNPMTTAGDIIYGGVGGTATRLATGAGFLKGGATPSYSAVNLASGDVSGVLPIAQGGTGLSAFGGGLLYASGPTTIGDIGNGTSGQMLLMTGTSPSWQTMSGDATIGGTALITIANNAITDVKVATGISGSKIIPSFGAQNISTTGTLTAGATTVSGLTIGTSVWPANASGVLTNNGTGTLSWAASSGWNLTGNAGTVDGTNYIGTSDNIPLNFRVNNQRAGRIESAAPFATFLGFQAGNVNTGAQNSAFGYQALRSNTTGVGNTAVGQSALTTNTVGGANTALGSRTLFNNTASNNTAVGNDAMFSNTTAGDNAAFGVLSLSANTAAQNAAFGAYSLQSNTSGTNNAGVGNSVLLLNTTGSQNTALGSLAGRTTIAANANTTGSANTFIGYASGPGVTTQLTNATAIGANAVVNQSNSLVLGSINGVNGATSDVSVGIGTTTPAAKLDIVGTIKITDGTQAAGRVLTSDANGLGSWTNPSALGWGLSGNTGTNFTSNFIGTTDATGLAFRTSNLRRMYITSTGQTVIDINPTNPIASPVGNAILDIVPSGTGIGNIVLRGSFANPNDPVDIEFRNWGGGTTLGAIAMSSTGQDMLFNVAGTTRMTLENAGNINFNNSNTIEFGGTPIIRNAGTANIFVGANSATNNTASNGTFLGVAAGRDNTSGGDNTFLGRNTGLANQSGTLNVYVGSNSGANTSALAASGNTFVGYLTGATNVSGDRITLIGREANVGSSALQNATAIGNLARVDQDNSMVLGSINGVNTATADTRVGIGTTTPANRLTVAAGTSIGAGYTATAAPTNGLIVQGNVGIGTTNSAVARMEVSSESSTTLNLNVNSISAITAYSLIRFTRNNGLTGNISESNGTVSYNAFTGSHYAKVEEEIKYGELATLTGYNNILNRQSGEVIYGIVPSYMENDPKLLGSYLSPLNDKDHSNIHQVMAVGNGEVWVIDTGKDLEAGDYLISSSTKGHAMLENETHDIAYVFARVAAPVRWDEVSETVNGVKHKRVSIFYESFIKNNKAIKLEKEIATMKSEIEKIKAALGLSIEAAAPAKNEIKRNEE